ncbi:14932_t:CDS:2 [Acaulospora colombiana]|uniref:14932_t:CDS:1 n=1 Tax=Acaulospora colombiana TaxID=27376 RepID=A0ACA9K2E3_9GLOM|nr:14932_t:CDS:2 [Acaulospora colombiana]
MHQFFRQLLLKCSNFSQAQQELKWLALYVLEKSRKNGDMITDQWCIALSLAHLLPPNTCHIYGIDNSSDALSLADLNLEVLNRKKILRNHVEFLKFDILEASIKEVKSFVREIKYNCDEEKGEGFDLIVSNPPYIARNEYATLDADVRLWEDEFALVADDNGTAFHNRITYLASRYLLRRKNYLPDDYHIKGERIISQHNVIKDMYDEMSRMSIPQIVMEIGGGHQVEKVTNDLKKHGFRRTEIWTDAANKESCY